MVSRITVLVLVLVAVFMFCLSMYFFHDWTLEHWISECGPCACLACYSTMQYYYMCCTLACDPKFKISYVTLLFLGMCEVVLAVAILTVKSVCCTWIQVHSLSAWEEIFSTILRFYLDIFSMACIFVFHTFCKFTQFWNCAAQIRNCKIANQLWNCTATLHINEIAQEPLLIIVVCGLSSVYT